MPLALIKSNNSEKRQARTLNFDSLNCGNFMNSFVIISATLRTEIDSLEKNLLEIEVTNEGDTRINDFHLYISLAKASEEASEATFPRRLEFRKKVQEIIPGQCLVFTLLIEPNQLKESNVISVWAQANKKTYLNSKLCLEIPL